MLFLEIQFANIKTRDKFMVFPLDIGSEINKSFFRQVEYQAWTGRWVVWDNDRGKAESLKQMMPYAYVFLYDAAKQIYTRYTIDVLVPKMTIHNGQFVEEFEQWTV
jgi:hypothetical protein